MQLKNGLQFIIFSLLMLFHIQSISAIGMTHTIDTESLKKLEVIVQQGCDRLGLIAKQNLCRAALFASGVIFIYWGTRLIFEYLRPSTNYYVRDGDQVMLQKTGPLEQKVDEKQSSSSQAIEAFLVHTLPSFRQRVTPYCIALGSIGVGAACFWGAWRL